MTAIKYFEIIGEVIETHIRALVSEKKLQRREIVAEVELALEEMIPEWYKLAKPNTHYDTPCWRIAYLYNQVAANSKMVEYAFENIPLLREFLYQRQQENQEASICALGGGPGTELLGLGKHLERFFPFEKVQVNLEFSLVDSVPEWVDSWRGFKSEIKKRFRSTYGDRNNWPFQVGNEFYRINVSDTINFANLGNCFGQDLHIMSLFASELYDIGDELFTFFRKMTSAASPGSKFLFIDRNEEKWKNAIQEIAEKSGMSLLDSCSMEEPNGRLWGSDEEQTKDLGPIFSEIGQDPKLKWNAFFRVGEKPDFKKIL